MATGDDEQDLTGQAVQVTIGGLNNGWDVSSRLPVHVTKDMHGQNLTCHLITGSIVAQNYAYSIEVSCKCFFF